MTAQHTPGPWIEGQDGFSLGNRVIYKRDGYKDGPFDIATIRRNGAEQQANARLIAAAPELLAMVIRLLDIAEHVLACEGHYVGDEDISDAKGLIAKVTGDST